MLCYCYVDCRVEVDDRGKKVKGKESCLLTLISNKNGTKDLNIEYATYETIEENRDAAIVWAEALTVCIKRAASIR